MKTRVSIILISLLFTDCYYGSINVKTDEVNDKSIIKMRLFHTPKDFTLVHNVESLYIKEFKDKKSYPTVMRLKIKTENSLQMFENKITFKIDNRRYVLPIHSITTDILSALSGKKNIGELDFSNIGKNDFTPKIILSKQVEQAILNAGTMMYTINSGSDFFTIKYSSGDIKRLKKFISYEP